MLFARHWRPLLFAVAVTCVVPSLSAIIAEEREYSTQEQAKVIELGEGEWLTGIDIKLPSRQ